MKLLVVDDEPTIREIVASKLRRAGYSVFDAATAEEGLGIYKKVRPDLLLLDVMLPGRSGYDLARAVRRETQTPIIFLTARASEQDKVEGLELGGDDYVVKPFSMAELLARVKAVLRRASGETVAQVLELDDLVIDTRTHEVTVRGQRVDLSPREFALLSFLAGNRGQVFTRPTLLDRVWKDEGFISERTVDVHVRWLRERIELDPGHPTRILTVRGVGYRFAG